MPRPERTAASPRTVYRTSIWRRPSFVIPFVGLLSVVVAVGVAVAILNLPPALTSAPSGGSTSGGGSVSAASIVGGPPCPLTGAPSGALRIPQRPAIAFKVDNYPSARPQSGLDKADLVVEEPVEGGITRLVAVFQCQGASLVGPIRSAREPDAAILDELSGPIFVHAGGIDPVMALIDHSVNKTVDCCTDSIVEHVTGRVAPYNTYTSTSAIWGQFSSDTTPPQPIFTFSAAAPTGTPVTQVHIPFSSTNDNMWTWNPQMNQWQLSIGGSPAMLSDGNQIAATNVVVMTVQAFAGPWVENAEGSHEVEVDPLSGGPLQVLRSGVSVAGTWSRSSLSQPAQLTASDGSPVSLATGNTWVELVPADVAVTIR